VAVAFAIGTMVHLAMGRYVFGLRKPPINDRAVIDELVVLVMGGLMGHDGECSRNQKETKKRKDGHGSS
jgi:hypothetical protein